MGLPKQVLDSLVDQHLLLQQARRLHLTAIARGNPPEDPGDPDAQSRRQVRRPGALRALRDRHDGLPVAGRVRRRTGARDHPQKMESALQNSIVVSPKAAEAEYRRINENAKIKLRPLSRRARSGQRHRHAGRGRSSTTRRTRRSTRTANSARPSTSSPTTPSSARRSIRPMPSCASVYEACGTKSSSRPRARTSCTSSSKSIRARRPAADAAAKAKAETLVKQLRAGADFAQAGASNSGDPSSSGKGGDMGWVDKGTTVEPFDTAAFSMPLNTISDPIRSTEFGYHIIKVLERRPAGYRPFEEVRDQLCARRPPISMAKDRARDEITRIAARIKDSKPKTADGVHGARQRQRGLERYAVVRQDRPDPGHRQQSGVHRLGVRREAERRRRHHRHAARSGDPVPLRDPRRPVFRRSTRSAPRSRTTRAWRRRAQLAQQALAKAHARRATVDAVGAKVGLPAAGDDASTVRASSPASAAIRRRSSMRRCPRRSARSRARSMIGDGAVAVPGHRTEEGRRRRRWRRTARSTSNAAPAGIAQPARRRCCSGCARTSTIDINKKLIEPATPQQAGV